MNANTTTHTEPTMTAAKRLNNACTAAAAALATAEATAAAAAEAVTAARTAANQAGLAYRREMLTSGRAKLVA